MFNKSALVVLSVLFWSQQVFSCLWVEIGDSKLECRSSYREFFSGDPERRKAVLNVAFKNAKRKLYEILNEQDVLSLMTESDVIYKAGKTDVIDEMIAEADKILEITNKITVDSDRYVKEKSPLSIFEDGTLSLYPSAYMVGFTVPMKQGVTLPFTKIIEKFSKTLPHLEVGGGSIFFGAVLVPQIAEYVAKHSPEGNFKEMKGRLIFEDKERNTRVYDLSDQTPWERLRLNDIALKAFSTADVKLSVKEVGAFKAGGLQPTLAMAWGDSIYSADHVGAWGVSYSLPTSLSRIPFGSPTITGSPLYQSSLLGRSVLTGKITWGLLKLLDMARVETAKISWNSSDNLAGDLENFDAGLENFPLDQVTVNVRWGDFKNRKIQRASEALSPDEIIGQTRLGLNFGVEIFGAFGSSSPIMGLLSDAFGEANKETARELTADEKAKIIKEQAESRLFQQSLTEVLESKYVDEMIQGREAGQGLTDLEIKALAAKVQESFENKLK